MKNLTKKQSKLAVRHLLCEALGSESLRPYVIDVQWQHDGDLSRLRRWDDDWGGDYVSLKEGLKAFTPSDPQLHISVAKKGAPSEWGRSEGELIDVFVFHHEGTRIKLEGCVVYCRGDKTSTGSISDKGFPEITTLDRVGNTTLAEIRERRKKAGF